MHIKDEVDRYSALDHSAKQQPYQEALACAALAENAIRALDQALEVDADRDVHRQRRAHRKELVAFALVSENDPKVALRSFG